MELSSKIPEKERMWFKLLSLWYQNNVQHQLQPATCRCYLLSINQIKENGANIYVKDIEEEFLQNIIGRLAKKGYAKSTVGKVKTVMNNAMLYAIRVKWIKSLPMMKLYIPKICPSTIVDALTKEEQQRVEDLCKKPETKYGHVTLFLLRTGLRADELYNLKWSDFYDSYKHSYIEIRKSKTKNGIRKVPLSSEALQIIEARPRVNEYIFTTENGCQLSYTQMKRHNQYIRETLGLEHFHNHICRHSFATRAVEKNMDIRALSKVLGHSSVAFTMQRYVTVFDDFLFEQMSLLE